MPKRRRTTSLDGSAAEKDDEQPPQPFVLDETGLTRSPDVWFEDGNLVLKAGKSLFKVYKGFLSKQSVVFGDLFSVAEPIDVPILEECPVVYLLGDSEEDVKHMLIALFDKRYETRAPLPVGVVGAMLRLGRKYEIQALTREGFRKLTTEFPTTLAAYDAAPDSGWAEFLSETGDKDLLFAATNLAFECDVRPALPLAYLCCALEDQETLILGHSQGQAKPVVLSPPVLQRVVKGRTRLLRAFQEAMEWVEDIGAHPGCDKIACQLAGKGVALSLWCPEPNLFFAFYPYLPFWWEDVIKEMDLCASCQELCKTQHALTRQRLWDDLPGYFDLPAWDVLRAQLDPE